MFGWFKKKKLYSEEEIRAAISHEFCWLEEPIANERINDPRDPEGYKALGDAKVQLIASWGPTRSESLKDFIDGVFEIVESNRKA